MLYLLALDDEDDTYVGESLCWSCWVAIAFWVFVCYSGMDDVFDSVIFLSTACYFTLFALVIFILNLEMPGLGDADLLPLAVLALQAFQPDRCLELFASCLVILCLCRSRAGQGGVAAIPIFFDGLFVGYTVHFGRLIMSWLI